MCAVCYRNQFINHNCEDDDCLTKITNVDQSAVLIADKAMRYLLPAVKLETNE